jgi:hypothetical protein
MAVRYVHPWEAAVAVHCANLWFFFFEFLFRVTLNLTACGHAGISTLVKLMLSFGMKTSHNCMCR